jgi:benzoyl-CoA reductase/2-hydroxyglutaryl-CoA dehydratase subunit BcrC/BadD/HgdB
VTPATELLATAYDNRLSHSRAAAASGTPVIGLVGADIPRSLVAAAGATPFRLFGVGQISEESAELLGRSVDSATLAMLTSILAGDYDFLTGILVSHDCQASIHLFYTLRELVRAGRLSVPVHLVDLVHLDREPSRVFDVAQLTEAARVLGTWTGTAVTAESLLRSMADAAELSQVLRQLQALRRENSTVLSGVDALHAYGVASAMPAIEAQALLRSVADSLTADADSPPTPTGLAPAIRIFLTGSSPQGDALYRAIEQQSVTIVGEDHDWGDLALTVVPAIPDGPPRLADLIDSLAVALLRAAPAAATSGQGARGQATRDGVAGSRATALLSIVREHDDAAAWDYPHQSTESGVPSALLARASDPVDSAQLDDALRELRVAV